MADVLNLKKKIRTLKLDDDPGSPSFELDLGDSSIDRLREPFARAYRVIAAFGKGSSEEELAGAYRSVISEALGDAAYDAILDYVTCGRNDAEDATIYLAPVVAYIFAAYSDAVTLNRFRLEEKYLEPDRG